MKRLIRSLFAGAYILAFLSIAAFATNTNTYRLDALGMRVEIPDNYIVFTRNVQDDDPNLSLYGLTKEDMLSAMETRDIYLNAWDENATFEIVVTMTESSLGDFNQLSDTELLTLASSLETVYDAAGVTYLRSEIYQNDQTKFLKIYINQPNDGITVYGVQYYTVYNGKAINLTLQSYEGMIDAAKESAMQNIVYSAHFDRDPVLSETPAATASFTYTDENSGVTFTVPANWVEAPMNQERYYLDAKFTSNLEEGLSIFFTCEDVYASEELWSDLSEAERNALTRSDIDNSIFTKSDIAELFGCEADEVSMVFYRGKEYFRVETVSSATTYGIDISVPMTNLVRCENGYIYLFQFNGHEDHPYFGDFEALVSSVEYPADGMQTDLTANLILNLLATIAIYSLPIILYRYAIKREPVGRSKAKKITIIYGICAFIVMSILIFAINGSGAAGGAILLWSWVNYRVLIGGAKPAQEPAADTPEQPLQLPTDRVDFTEAGAQTEMPPPELPAAAPVEKTAAKAIRYCHKCGARLPLDGLFCSQCGIKIEQREEH